MQHPLLAKANRTRCFTSCSMGSSWWIHGETARAKVQKIEELERQNAGLEQDLELLRSSEPLGAEVLAV